MHSMIQRFLFLITFMLVAGAAFSQGLIAPAAGNGTAGFSGDGGPAINAALNSPQEVAIGAGGAFFIADRNNNRVRQVDASGVISTVAGNGSGGWFFASGPATSASLDHPEGVAIDSAGNLFIAEFLSTGVSRIHKVDTSGNITAVPISVVLNGAVAIALDPSGQLYISEEDGHRIRKVDPNTGNLTTVAGTGVAGFSGDGGPATSAQLNHPVHLAFDSAGNLYVADSFNNRIRKIAAGTGTISTVAGSSLAGGFSGDGGPATSAQLNRPQGVDVDAAGDILIADTLNQRIRRVRASNGVITTIVSADGCAAITSSLQAPSSVTIDSSGLSLFIDDENGNRIWKISLPDETAPPTLTAITPPTGVLGSAMSVTLTGSGFLGVGDASCRLNGLAVVIGGSGVTAGNLNATSNTSLTATFNIAANATVGPHDVTITTEGGTSAAVPFTVQVPVSPAPTLTSVAPGSAVPGFTGTFTLTGTNFDTKPGATTVAADGTGIVITNVKVASANSLTATFAISGSALGVHNVTVSTSGGGSNPQPLTVQPGTPSFVYNMPQIMNPTDQTAIDVALARVLANAVTGTLTLSFTPNATNPADDPNATFVNGDKGTRSSDLTFPAETVAAHLSLANGVLQAGTVAGTLELNVTNVQVAGSDVAPTSTPFDIQIPQLPPVITSVRIINRTSHGFDLEVTGYSTPRDITGATFDFGAATGQRLLTLELSPDVTSTFTTYYQSPPSDPVGSAFVYIQPFVIKQGTVNAVASVTVALSNSVGKSDPATAQ